MMPGCRMGRPESGLFDGEEDFESLVYEVDYSDAYESPDPESEPLQTEEPWSIREELPEQYLDLTLEQALQLALQNATILRDLGGRILTAPETLEAIHNPGLKESDPRFGVEAALSQFDAQLHALGQFQKNDRAFNNFFVGGGTQLFQQDYHNYQLELGKTTATGTKFTARGLADYDANNRAQNLFGSYWDTQAEMEVRQPLLQGAGTEFNRIAGPNGRPGALDGIVIARINADIAVTDFEVGLRNFVSNVENAYWDLYYAYRLLDAKLEARDQSLRTWKSTSARIGQKGITAAKEAQAREQYFRFETEMRNALAGRTRNLTQTHNGNQPGTFTSAGGLYVAERRLRLLLGLPLKEQAVIRPVSEPKISPVEFDWHTMVEEAAAQRPELKRQRQLLKSLELQKEASMQFLKPRLDAFGRYRWRGFGKGLIGSTPPTPGNTLFQRGSIESLFHGSFQEWEMGFEMTMPVGYRQGHAAVRHLELQIARNRAMLYEQQREIVHDLSDATAELKRTQTIVEFNYNRLISSQQRFEALNEDIDSPDEILDAQVRLAESKSAYYQSLVEHEIALRNIHYEKGSLLPFRNVILADNFSDENEEQTTSPSDMSIESDILSVPPDPSATPESADSAAGFAVPPGEPRKTPLPSPIPPHPLTQIGFEVPAGQAATGGAGPVTFAEHLDSTEPAGVARPTNTDLPSVPEMQIDLPSTGQGEGLTPRVNKLYE